MTQMDKGGVMLWTPDREGKMECSVSATGWCIVRCQWVVRCERCGGGWRRYLAICPLSLPPPVHSSPPPLHKSTLSATGHHWAGQAAKSCQLVRYPVKQIQLISLMYQGGDFLISLSSWLEKRELVRLPLDRLCIRSGKLVRLCNLITKTSSLSCVSETRVKDWGCEARRRYRESAGAWRKRDGKEEELVTKACVSWQAGSDAGYLEDVQEKFQYWGLWVKIVKSAESEIGSKLFPLGDFWC